jgi:hypothetical protein
VILNPNPHRKDVWNQVPIYFDRFRLAFDLTNLGIKISRSGLVVFKEHLAAYCDGRSHPEVIASEWLSRSQVVFVPFVYEHEYVPVDTRTYMFV